MDMEDMDQTEWLMFKKSYETESREHGQWVNFVKRREALKKEGQSPRDAWMQTIREMPLPVCDHFVPGIKSAIHHHDPRRQGLMVEFAPVDQNAIESSVLGDRKVPYREAVEWVAQNLEVSDVQGADAPSSAAWSMLVWARTTPVTKGEFWKNIHSKLAPRQETSKEDEARSDDGEDAVVNVIDMLLNAKQRAVAGS